MCACVHKSLKHNILRSGKVHSYSRMPIIKLRAHGNNPVKYHLAIYALCASL